MTLARLTVILDAYGADPAGWPDAERSAALALMARSPEARAAHAEAQRLDEMLDTVAAVAPSAALADQIVAGIPEVRTTRGWRIVVGLVPLAAAAALALVILRPGPRSAPGDLTAEAIAQLGVWTVPTDGLLADAGLAVIETTPAFGCDDALGCPELDGTPASESRNPSERIHV